MEPSAAVLLLIPLAFCCFPHASSAAPSPPDHPLLCSVSGKPPVILGEPLRFCGYSSGGMSCCNTADAAALEALFQSMNVPHPHAMVVKNSLCLQRCRPRGWSEEQQATAGFDDFLVQQQLLDPQTLLLLMGPFALWGLYQACRFVASFCLGLGQAAAPSSPTQNERRRPNANGICGSIFCMCCSTASYLSFSRYDRVLFGETSNRRA